MKKNCYFSHSELKSKFKKSRNKSWSSKIEKEFIDNSSEIIMTAQTMKYMWEHSAIYKLDFDIIENINIDFVYSNFIVNRTQFILNSGATMHICYEKVYFSEINSTNAYIAWGTASKIKIFEIEKVSINFMIRIKKQY